MGKYCAIVVRIHSICQFLQEKCDFWEVCEKFLVVKTTVFGGGLKKTFIYLIYIFIKKKKKNTSKSKNTRLYYFIMTYSISCMTMSRLSFR